MPPVPAPPSAVHGNFVSNRHSGLLRGLARFDSDPLPFKPREYGWKVWVPPLVVLVAGAVLGALLLQTYLGQYRRLWSDTIHDRNAHLHTGLSTALDLTHGRLLDVLSDIDKCRTWPPFHDAFLVGTSLALADCDVRWAVLPSLLAWIGTAVFAFLAARRASGTGGITAGFLAALFVLASSAQRAYATDVMVESTGAFLTLVCIYCYLAVRQAPAVGTAFRFSLALTALFFTKYNYWLLVVIALAADQILNSFPAYVAGIRGALTHADRFTWIWRELRHPLNWLVALLVGAILAIHICGLTQVSLLGRQISLRSPANLMTAAYGLFLLRVFLWYRRGGRLAVQRSGVVIQGLAAWHILPIALWMLWPQRIYSLLWFTNPISNAGEHPQFNLLGGYEFYWECLRNDYMLGIASVLAVVVLAGIGLAACLRRRLPPGASAIFCLVLVSFLLTAHHPNRKSRFLHSWVAVSWVAAGVGAGWLVRSRPGITGSAVRAGALVAVGAMAAWNLSALGAAAHAPEGGIAPEVPSALTLSDIYLPYLQGSHRAAILSNMPIKWLARWTFLERYDRTIELETDIPGFEGAGPASRARFDVWLSATKAERLVFVHIPPGSPLYGQVPGLENMEEIGPWLERQTVFEQVQTLAVSGLGCTVTIWKRR